MTENQHYWNNKFIKQGLVWGVQPSPTAEIVTNDLVGQNPAEIKLLDVGCGYGRDVKYLSDLGFDILGVDISESGIEMGLSRWPECKLKCADIMNQPFNDQSFHVITAHFFVHLFIDPEVRKKLIKYLYALLHTSGKLYFTVSSQLDPDFIKPNDRCVVENKRGVSKVYYSNDMIKSEFSIFKSLTIVEYTESHTHDTPHQHHSYLVCAQK